MSSDVHQSYTRAWANELGVPIISVDYRLAPQSNFPDQLNDCWQIYHWLVLHAEEELGIKPDTIILVGDSAGGNLIMALTVMAIQRGFRIPDGVLSCYGAIQLNTSVFTPSLLFSIDDPILPFSLLMVALHSYVGERHAFDQEFLKHPYISPAVASDEVLRQFPPVAFMLACDSFRDENLKFALRLL